MNNKTVQKIEEMKQYGFKDIITNLIKQNEVVK